MVLSVRVNSMAMNYDKLWKLLIDKRICVKWLVAQQMLLPK